MIPDRRAGAPDYHGWWQGDQDQVGAFLHGYESLWLPASLLSEGERQRLADALFAASRYKKVGLHFNKGLAGAPDDAIAAARDTATNPRVTEAFALVIIADGEGPRYPGLARPPLDAAAARRMRARSIWRRPSCAGSRRTPGPMFRRATISIRVAGRVLGSELSAPAGDQGQIRSRRPVLRPSRRRQRRLDRRWLYEALRVRLERRRARRMR